ncbi:hypothetical protein [Kitasatospora sp. NPDC088134]|uniref:hypothetical protein n=1 Tax=Kitasatospora sp. NPDC088134 TaxID=3364071 RepID=UPI0038175BFA
MRRWWVWCGVLLLVVVGASAGWWFGGGYERWQDGRSLRGLCGGAVDTGEVPDVLGGSGRLKGTDRGGSENWLARCTVGTSDRSGLLSVDIGWGESAAGESLSGLSWTEPARTRGQWVAPLGAGWTGVVTTGRTPPAVVLALPCTGPSAGKHLVVSTRVLLDVPEKDAADPQESPETRAGLGRITVRTAERASARWNCGAVFGARIERVPGAESRTRADAGTEGGSCAGVPGPVGEGPADAKAPIENCTALRADDTRQVSFELTAFQPPFAQGMRTFLGPAAARPGPGTSGELRWATASCPTGEALYLLRTRAQDRTPAADALAGFARRSAERHGCEAPRLP